MQERINKVREKKNSDGMLKRLKPTDNRMTIGQKAFR